MDRHSISQDHQRRFLHQVARQQRRKVRARKAPPPNIWSGLGVIGLVGWSVVVPTLLGLALGLWLDRQFPRQFSWTLMLLLAGLGLGCLNAGWWVAREQTALHNTIPSASDEKQSYESLDE